MQNRSLGLHLFYFTLLCLFNRSYSDYLYCFTKSYLLFIRFSHSVYISFKSLYTLPSAAMPLRGGTATISLYHILPCSLSYFTKSLPLCSIWAINWSKFIYNRVHKSICTLNWSKMNVRTYFLAILLFLW